MTTVIAALKLKHEHSKLPFKKRLSFSKNKSFHHPSQKNDEVLIATIATKDLLKSLREGSFTESQQRHLFDRAKKTILSDQYPYDTPACLGSKRDLFNKKTCLPKKGLLKNRHESLERAILTLLYLPHLMTKDQLISSCLKLAQIGSQLSLNHLSHLSSTKHFQHSSIQAACQIAMRQIQIDTSMKIAFVSFEAKPWVNGGGLGNVMKELLPTIQDLGHQSYLIIPYHECMTITQKEKLKQPITTLKISLPHHQYNVSIYTTANEKSGTTYFIRCPEFFNRYTPYDSNGKYGDDAAERSDFFSLATVELLQFLADKKQLSMDIIQLNDAHTGPAARYLCQRRLERNNLAFIDTTIITAIHNNHMYYQGRHPLAKIDYLGFKGFNDHYPGQAAEYWGQLNFLKYGIENSDGCIFVSKEFMNDALQPGTGEGLDGVLREKYQEGRVWGNLNGIDPKIWDPKNDHYLPAHFTLTELLQHPHHNGKRHCKHHLQQRYLLPIAPEAPLFGVVSRLASQKGFPEMRLLVTRILEKCAEAQFIICGEGEPEIALMLKQLQDQFRNNVRFDHHFHPEKEHQIIAGSDFFVMTSAFEPCGLPQMYSMAYGTIPYVHGVGGLKESVQNFNPQSRTGNGFVYYHSSHEKIDDIINWYEEGPVKRLNLIKNAMSSNFSWRERSAPEQISFFREIRHKTRSLQHPCQSKIINLTCKAPRKGGIYHLPKKKNAPVKIKFELSVKHDYPDIPLNSIKACLRTNATSTPFTTNFQDYPMTLTKTLGNISYYHIDIDVHWIGSFRATAFIEMPFQLDGSQEKQWANQYGDDLIFRPYSEELDSLNMQEIFIGSINCRSQQTDDTIFKEEISRDDKFSTFEDLIASSNGKMTIDQLKELGKNAIWLMPPFPVSKNNIDIHDPAGSPYSITDFFSIRPELSTPARNYITGSDPNTYDWQQTRTLAIESFRTFIKECHQRSIKVILDIPLNHVAEDFKLIDYFPEDGPGTIRVNDVSQIAINDSEQKISERKIINSLHNQATILPSHKAKKNPLKLKDIIPQFFASQWGDPAGARNESEIATAGHGHERWYGTLQINHGRLGLNDGGWRELPRILRHEKVQQYLVRVLRFWAELGVDGFRLDYISGLPVDLLEKVANKVGSITHKDLIFIGEDFHTLDRTRSWIDLIQGGYFNDFLKARNTDDFKKILDDPWFSHNLLNLSSHDEKRPFWGRIEKLKEQGWNNIDPIDTALYSIQLNQILLLLGGPFTDVAGDQFGAIHKMPYKQHWGIDNGVEHHLPQANLTANDIFKSFQKIGRVRTLFPALQSQEREWLFLKRDDEDIICQEILAVARFAKNMPTQMPLIILSNLRPKEQSQTFSLDRGKTLTHIDKNTKYFLFDHLSQENGYPIDGKAYRGDDLLNQGLFLTLKPYQSVVIEIIPVGEQTKKIFSDSELKV